MSGFAPDHAGAEVRVSPNFGPRRGVVAAGHDHPALYRHGDRARRPKPGSAIRQARSRRTISSTRTAASCRWCARATAPGMPARAPGAARPTSIPARSASRSSIRAMRSATANFPKRQIEAVIELCRGITARHAIRPERVLAHSDVAPGRKIDPGEKFPVAAAGRGRRRSFCRAGARRRRPVLAPGDSGAAVEELQSMLSLYGYGIDITGVFDERTGVVVAAFQRHFRPRAGRRAGRPLDGRDAAPAACRRCRRSAPELVCPMHRDSMVTVCNPK